MTEKRFKQLEKENLDLSEELDYYKTKCASLETGLFQADKEIEELKKNCKNYNWYKQYKTLLNENEQLKSKNRGLQSELQIFKEDITHSNLQINKLTDENEELKQQLKTRVIVNKQYEELQRLKKENEQLKKDATILIYANQDYRKENEQLKADKQSLIDFIRKEFPKSHKHILEGFE